MFFPKDKLFLIAGPCLLESYSLIEEVCGRLKEITKRLDIPYLFKASFDKANRSSIESERGPGLERGLAALERLKKTQEVAVVTDVHTPETVHTVGAVVDVIQLPAFLARQTDFYLAAGKIGAAMNVKKGQFMAPQEIANVVKKFEASRKLSSSKMKKAPGELAITERGTCFGYGDLVVDFRSIEIIKSFGVPYIYDATHSLQKPAGRGSSSGGELRYLRSLLRGQVAAGANGIFMETHPNPKAALSDREVQVPLSEVEGVLEEVVAVRAALAQLF